VRSHGVCQATSDAVATTLDEQELIELVLLIGAYAMVGGLLNGVGVEPEADLVGFPRSGAAAQQQGET
jgi:hypothetical protein